MNKEQIEKRLAIINESIAKHQEQIQQCIANINLLQGSKNECLFWLDELAKPQAEQPKEEAKLEEVKEEVKEEAQAA